LLIDDDEEIYRLVALILEREGLEVAFSADGVKGVEKVRADKPDLVILNIQMPGLNGWDVFQRIRTFSNVPVLFLSAREDEQIRQQAQANGGDYLLKPFPIEHLRSRIEALLSSS
jgi:DNA-binding response OmpR family regulator